jgi:hypothetical protein
MYRDVAVQILALERVGDDRLVLHAHQVVVAARSQRADRALELPRRRVRAGKREVPRDVVLEDRGRARLEGGRDAGQVVQAVEVVEDVIGADAYDRDLRA